MTTLKKASIEELEFELKSRKEILLSEESKKEKRYNELKQDKLGHCIIYWNGSDGGSSTSLLGNYRCGERWFACANWVGENDTMKVTPLRDYVLQIKKIEMI